MRSPVYEKPTILMYEVTNDPIPMLVLAYAMDKVVVIRTEIDKVQGESVDLILEMLDSNCVDRETGKTTRKVAIHKLYRVSS